MTNKCWKIQHDLNSTKSKKTSCTIVENKSYSLPLISSGMESLVFDSFSPSFLDSFPPLHLHHHHHDDPILQYIHTATNTDWSCPASYSCTSSASIQSLTRHDKILYCTRVLILQLIQKESLYFIQTDERISKAIAYRDLKTCLCCYIRFPVHIH